MRSTALLLSPHWEKLVSLGHATHALHSSPMLPDRPTLLRLDSHVNRTLLVPLFTLATIGTLAAQAPLPLKHAPQPTTSAITTGDLMTRLYIIADDSMKGRQAGSAEHQKVTAYIASELKRMGLEPAGDSGGYFQSVPLVRRHFEQSASLTAGTTALRPDSDFVPLVVRGTPRDIDGAQSIYGGVFTDSSTWITADQARGKLVVFSAGPASGGAALLHDHHSPDEPLRRRRRRRDSDARERAARVSRARHASPDSRSRRRSTGPESAAPLHLLISPSAARTLLGGAPDSLTPGALGPDHPRLHQAGRGAASHAQRRRRAARLRSALRGEYVAIGAHSDHIGTRDCRSITTRCAPANEQAWEMRGRVARQRDAEPAAARARST